MEKSPSFLPVTISFLEYFITLFKFQIIDIFYSITQMPGLWNQLINSPQANMYFVPNIIKFYSEAEAATDFYTKFTIRRSIQYILQILWDNSNYKAIIVHEAK